MEGDVFLILLKDCTTAEKVKDKVEQIREKLSSIYVGKEIERGCSVSVGAALYPKHGNEFHELLECARKALNLEKTKDILKTDKQCIIDKVTETISNKVLEQKQIKDQMPKKSELNAINKEWSDELCNY